MKTLAILGVLCALPVLSQAAVTYEHEWKAGSAKSVAHTLEAPAGKYRLDIQTNSTTPIAVYSGFKGNKAAPLIQLNQGKQGSSGSGSAEIELRPTKPDHAYGYAPITVRIGSGKTSGQYQLQLTPLF